ncbi:MAG: DUF63 family protein [Candidatus Thermoplasmatota archaeon]|nr:DUF63 family protein [Candidatus Thermoplasmatota archaeon]
MALSRKAKNALIAAAILMPIAVVVIGCILPQTHEAFYTNFVWKYFWGPSVADIEGHAVQYNGVWAADEYTLISEFTYGAILVVCLLGIYKVLQAAKVRLDDNFIYAMVPFIFIGPILRVFEDALLFRPLIQYLFISPFLFFLMGGMVLLLLLIGARIRDLYAGIVRQTIYFGAVMGITSALYAIAYLKIPGQFAYMVPPSFVALYSAASVIVFFLAGRKNGASPAMTAFSFGIFTLAVSGHVFVEWVTNPWAQPIVPAQPMMIPVTMGVAAAVMLLVFAAAKLLSRKFPKAAVFASPVNLMMVLGHQVDAWASTIAINTDVQKLFGLSLAPYGEKHPISEAFLGFGGDYWFIAIKLALILLMVYLIDISAEEDMKKYPALKILIKLTIIALGMGPGTRDFLRAAMSV